MNFTAFGELLTFHVALPAAEVFTYPVEYLLDWYNFWYR